MVARLDSNFRFLCEILAYSLGLVSLSIDASAAASNSKDVYHYKFSWGFVPVANLEIDFSEYGRKNLIISRGETTGLSRLLKSYSARVSVKMDPVEQVKYYELLGRDRGSREVRKITFRHGELPELIEFKDKTSPKGLTAVESVDNDSVDPLSIFSWFFTEKVIENRCDKKFKVFDGKKRFLVKVQIMEDRALLSGAGDQVIGCRITMLGRSLEISKELGGQVKANFWPFNRKDQVIDLVIEGAAPAGFFIREIQIHSPLGKIIGKLR